MQKKRKTVCCLGMIAIMLCLMGCGEKNNQSEGEAPTKTESKEEQNAVTGELAFSMESGCYEQAFSLQLTGGGEIYYTTDGSNPADSDSAVLYTGNIEIRERTEEENVVSAAEPELFAASYSVVNGEKTGFTSKVTAPEASAVDKCTVIRAARKNADGTFSETITNTYFVGSMETHIPGIGDSVAAAGSNLAVISISAEYEDFFDPTTGIYVKGTIFEEALKSYLAENTLRDAETARSLDANYKQKGRDWERKVHIDFFECSPEGAELVLSQDCGIRIQGNYSRSDLQKGLRLYARTEYGEKKFDYPVFGTELRNQEGEVIDRFKTLTLRAGGNCAFTAKLNDTYWQTLVAEDMTSCTTQKSRPCIVYLNGEYWGLYVLQEDYDDDYFEEHYGVSKDTVVLYKGDTENYACGYKLDIGDLPAGETEENYYLRELLNFFDTHADLTAAEDFEEFEKLVDVTSVMDYFLAEIWINNKWDWPGKNWSIWKTTTVDPSVPYGDGRWRFCFYDMEFGGVSGSGDAKINTIFEDNYRPKGLLDLGTENPAVLCFAYLMTNEGFREEFNEMLLAISYHTFEKDNALRVLTTYQETYAPLYPQFFERYPGSGSTENAVNGGYASIKCIRDFLEQRADYVQKMVDYVNQSY